MVYKSTKCFGTHHYCAIRKMHLRNNSLLFLFGGEIPESERENSVGVSSSCFFLVFFLRAAAVLIMNQC